MLRKLESGTIFCKPLAIAPSGPPWLRHGHGQIAPHGRADEVPSTQVDDQPEASKARLLVASLCSLHSLLKQEVPRQNNQGKTAHGLVLVDW
jgi:hypothetical protein